MSHQDHGSDGRVVVNAQALRQVMDWLLDDDVVWDDVCFRKDCLWKPKTLAATALLWVWGDEKTLGDRFATARKITARMFRLQQQPAGSYQAWTKMLLRWTVLLLAAVARRLRRRMRHTLRGDWKIGDWPVMAVDGSRVELPRTESNQARYCPKPKPKKKSKKKQKSRQHKSQKQSRATHRKNDNPQIWLTTMWHVGTGLPWDWRSGPSDSSEREHLQQMIEGLPAHSLVTADAGFVGYQYWKALLDAGHQFVIRVGANVKLLKNLGYVRQRAGLVYLWPDRAAAKNQPPLVLRLVVVHNGKNPVYLVTSVLNENELPDEEVVEIYRLRWGIEVFYRSFKQTYERRKLRSKNADNAQIELDWSLLGLWAVCLYALHVQRPTGVSVKRLSAAGVLRALRRTMRHYQSRPDEEEVLETMLLKAVIDQYERKNKSSRDYPRKKQETPAGKPKLLNATKTQIKQAKALKKRPEIGLTA